MISEKNCFFVWGMAHTDLFCASWVQKWQFLEVLPIFFRTTKLQLKLLILIESPNIFHWESAKKQSGCGLGTKFGPNWVQCSEKSKKTGIINFFFSYLHGEYILKQEVEVVQTPEWKFKANIARNATFAGR